MVRESGKKDGDQEVETKACYGEDRLVSPGNGRPRRECQHQDVKDIESVGDLAQPQDLRRDEAVRNTEEAEKYGDTAGKNAGIECGWPRPGGERSGDHVSEEASSRHPEQNPDGSQQDAEACREVESVSWEVNCQ